jgi:protein ImuB
MRMYAMLGALYSVDGDATDVLAALAADFTPRFEICGPREVVLDLAGLERLFGSLHAIAEELARAAAERQVRVRVAIAGTSTAARLLVRSGQWALPTVVECGSEAAAVAPLPIGLLPFVANANDRTNGRNANAPNDLLPTFRRWGLRTLGDLAALPADAVAARLGSDGTRWRRLACGEDLQPLRPEVPAERFEQSLDLEWPIDGLEPLSFVLGRLLDPLTAHLARRGRGAAVLHLRLHLVTRMVHERSLQLPAPMRDARTFRTLLLLDLESHPPSAAIDRVVVAVDPTPARVMQYSLLARPLPSPEQLSTLTARLGALMGEDRCGSPVVVDTWQPGALAMKPFALRDDESPRRPRDHGTPRRRDTEAVPRGSVDVNSATTQPVAALRRFRFPVRARVRMEQDTPLQVTTDRHGLAGGRVRMCAGPWRTSGGWWTDVTHSQRPTPNSTTPKLEIGTLGVGGCSAWDRDEWDITLSDGATYRVFRDRVSSAWFVEGTYD